MVVVNENERKLNNIFPLIWNKEPAKKSEMSWEVVFLLVKILWKEITNSQFYWFGLKYSLTAYCEIFFCNHCL